MDVHPCVIKIEEDSHVFKVLGCAVLQRGQCGFEIMRQRTMGRP